jgi:hypothetical protein
MHTDDPAFFFPGHMKYDYDYSIGRLKPDIVVSLWGRIDVAQKYLQSRYTEAWLVDSNVYMLKDSPDNSLGTSQIDAVLLLSVRGCQRFHRKTKAPLRFSGEGLG